MLSTSIGFDGKCGLMAFELLAKGGGLREIAPNACSDPSQDSQMM